MTDRTDTLPPPDLWHDPETGHWKRLTKPDRPTYEPYHAADTVHRLLAERDERIARLEEALRGLDAYVCNSITTEYPTGVDLDAPAFVNARAALRAGGAQPAEPVAPGFVRQIAAARESVQQWPQWMQAAAITATTQPARVPLPVALLEPVDLLALQQRIDAAHEASLVGDHHGARRILRECMQVIADAPLDAPAVVPHPMPPLLTNEEIDDMYIDGRRYWVGKRQIARSIERRVRTSFADALRAAGVTVADEGCAK